MQTPGQFAEGQGEAVSSRYCEERAVWEIGRHRENDDGTEDHFRRCHGARDEYRDTGPEAITDDSPVVVLCELGLSNHDLCQLEKHFCYTIADVRKVLADGLIPQWVMCGVVMEANVRRAVENIPG